MPKKVSPGFLNLEKQGGVFRLFWSFITAKREFHYYFHRVWTILSGSLDSLNESFEYLLYSERLYLNERKMPFGRVKDYV